MRYSQLGRTGLKVSHLCVGSLGFGPEIAQPEAHELLDRSLELGINFVDTSNVYGHKHGGDWAEEIIGRWFAKGGGRREKTIIATKVYEAQSEWPNDSRLSARHIRQACDASLQRLKTDHIDLYQMHHVDRETPWDEIWEAMEVLRYQGKIIYVGSSNFAGWHIAQAQEGANRRHFFGLASEQSLYNLMVRDVERELLPAAHAYGVGVIAWSPLNRGLLGGILARERAGALPVNFNGTSSTGPTRGSQSLLDENRTRLEEFESLAQNIDVSPAQLALAWLFSRKEVASAIIGPTTIEQLEEAVKAVDIELDDATIMGLDKIFPGFRTAPEDYAW